MLTRYLYYNVIKSNMKNESTFNKSSFLIFSKTHFRCIMNYDYYIVTAYYLRLTSVEVE